MKRHYTFLLLALFAIANIHAQSPSLGIAVIDGKAYKFVSNDIMGGMMTQMGMGTSGYEIPAFQADLQMGLNALVPAWLEDSGASDLAVWDRANASEEELQANSNFGQAVQSLSFMSSTKGKKVKAMSDNLSVSIRDQSNDYADQLDRDYLFVIKVTATHGVRKKKINEPIPASKPLNGSATVFISIIDAADATVVSSTIKTFNDGRGLRTSFNPEKLVDKCEPIVKGAYKKFLKEVRKRN